ncbi:MAG: F5/8 type C domain protein [Tenericutes bacterium ADurb.Bin087]|nr:MAG: F5/8 type C domain protein [Tenericutes bacterium ADurb.Bin087]
MKVKRGLLILTAVIVSSAISFKGEVPIKVIGTMEYGVDLAFGRRVVSSGHTDNHLNIHAVDANRDTRYAAVRDDNAFFYIDLGGVERVGKVVIDWEAAYASEYLLQMSMDAVTWTTVATVTKTNSEMDEIVFPEWVETQFVKFQGVRRALEYGYSFYSFEVYGPKSLGVGGDVIYASSFENASELPAAAILDDKAHTRWASTQNDNEGLIFDFKAPVTFDLIKVRWEVSFARIFKIYKHTETSDTSPAREADGWEYLTGTEAGLGEVDTFKLKTAATSRYVKVELIQRETSEATKKTGRYPWESTFSIYSFDIYKESELRAVRVGHPMEFSKNSPAWVAMSNITLHDEGLILAPHGYPIAADGVVTNMESIADGNIPGFESYATYNPAVIYDEDNDIFHMIYRSELPDNYATYFGTRYELGHMSTLSYAYSYDGIHYTRGANNPIAWPTIAEEHGGGLEDPRIFKIKNDPRRGGLTTYYITYTMYDYSITREGMIYTHDFITFNKVGRLAPDYNEAYKSGTFVTDPEGNAIKISDPRPGKFGEVYMIYMKDGGYTRIGFTNDVTRIEASDIIDIDTSSFGPNDIEKLTKGNESCMALTNIYGADDQDIYLMYGGGVLSDANIQYQQPNASGWFYALGVLKTTQSNPFELTNVTLDLDEPTMYPTDTNKIDYGLFNKCMFADTMLRHNNKWYFYYGAGDMYVGLATARGDFSAGAATFTLSGTNLEIATLALNKRYANDKSDYEIEFVIEGHHLNGDILFAPIKKTYNVPHFSKLPLGKYANGIPLNHTIDLTDALFSGDYYLSAYVINKNTAEVINLTSYYLVITPTITHRAR